MALCITGLRLTASSCSRQGTPNNRHCSSVLLPLHAQLHLAAPHTNLVHV